MKILAVSDRVVDSLYEAKVKERYPDIDLLVGCGDLPFYYLEFLISALDVPLVYVRGNHDAGPQYTVNGRVLTSVQGGYEVHGRTVNINGRLLAGLEGSMRYRPDAPHMYSEAEMTFQVARLAPALLVNRWRYGRALDILVTHSPPFQIHDNEDRAHTGFKIFRAFMRYFRPRYLLHGHVHVYRRDIPCVTRYEETTVINVYPYRMIQYEDAPLLP
jgi:uncharacterized protein